MSLRAEDVTVHELLADQATFEVSLAMKPTFHFEKAGHMEGTTDYAGVTPDGIPFILCQGRMQKMSTEN